MGYSKLYWRYVMTTPQEQTDANIDRLKDVYAKVKRQEYIDKIFEHKEDAKELDFNEGDLH